MTQEETFDLAVLQYFLEETLFVVPETPETGSPASKATLSPPSSPYRFYGDNKQGVVILVDIATPNLYKSPDFAFLVKVLEAVKLTLNECAILNLHENDAVTLSDLGEVTALKKLLLFGVSAGRVGISSVTPSYTVNEHENIQWLQVDTLSAISENRDKKQGLWAGLKRIFSA
jgi:hypothetical protein